MYLAEGTPAILGEHGLVRLVFEPPFERLVLRVVEG
jgi:hypothetical protein